MAKFRQMKTSFVAGEISGSSSARTDLPQYPHASKLLRNMIPFKSGGAYRRPGTFFETSLAAATDYAPHLIPFVVNRSEAYALWIERVVGGNTVMGGKRSTSNTAISTSSNFTGTLPYQPAKTGTLGTIGYYDEWRSVQFAQSVDVLTLVHPNYCPYQISRTSTDNFTITKYTDLVVGGISRRDMVPYLPQSNSANISLKVSAVSGNGITLTSDTNLFDPKHVGAIFKINDGAGNYGACICTAFTDAKHMTANVITTFGDTNFHLTWWESAWSDFRGWPVAVGFYKNRIVYGGTTYNPDSLWFSQAYNYNVLSVAATVDPRSEAANNTPFTFELEQSQTNRVVWIAPDKTLVVGTSAAEWVLGPDPASGLTGFGSLNASAVRQSTFGSSAYPAVKESNELLICSTDQSEIRALIFNLIENSYHDEPVQLLFDEYPEAETQAFASGTRKYRQMAWDNSRRTLWCCDTNGNLFGMSRDPRIQFTAWHSHQMGGFDATKTGGRPEVTACDPIGGMCAGSVVSVCVVPNPILGTDDVWVAVKRYENSAYSYHIERMIGARQPYKSAYGVLVSGEGTYLTDASVFNTNAYPLPETYVFGSLNHLIGVAPVGTAFGSSGIFYVTGDAVTNLGNTTLQKTYPTGILTESQSYVFGLGFTSYVVPVRPDAGSQIGSAQGAVKRVHEVNVRFWRTMCASVGVYQDTLGGSIKSNAINFHDPATAMGKTAELFTGDKRVKVEGDYDRDAYIAIVQDKPLPFAVLGISMEGMTSDG